MSTFPLHSPTMECLQLEQPGLLHLRRRETPEPADCQVLLRISHCALCRTDVKMFKQGHRDLILPRVLGHEICGADAKTEERFVVWPGRSCGACRPCLRGAENLCREMRILGFHREGGLAEFVAVEKSALIPIPTKLPGEIACLAEPLACALNALQQVNLGEGEKLLIFGAGPVGLLMALAAVSKGIDTRVTEISPSKLQRSEQFRRRLNIPVAQDEKDAEFDAAINAAPAAETFISGLAKLRPGGCFCVFSGLTDAVDLPTHALNDIHYRQLRVVGAYGCTCAQMADAVELLSNRQRDVLLLIERRLPLEDVPDALLQILSGERFKFVVEFQPKE